MQRKTTATSILLSAPLSGVARRPSVACGSGTTGHRMWWPLRTSRPRWQNGTRRSRSPPTSPRPHVLLSRAGAVFGRTRIHRVSSPFIPDGMYPPVPDLSHRRRSGSRLPLLMLTDARCAICPDQGRTRRGHRSDPGRKGRHFEAGTKVKGQRLSPRRQVHHDRIGPRASGKEAEIVEISAQHWLHLRDATPGRYVFD